MKTAGRRISIALAFVIIFQGISPGAAFGSMDSHSSTMVEALPQGRVGVEYEYQLQAEGGLAPLTWRLVDGELPPGINLDAFGRLRGVPAAARREAYRFALEVSDSSQTPQRFAQPFILTIQAAPLRIVTPPGKLRVVTHEQNGAVAPEIEEPRRLTANGARAGNSSGEGNDGRPASSENTSSASNESPPPNVQIPLVEGAKIIYGVTSPKAKVKVLIGGEAKKDGDADKDGKFSIELDEPLKTGQMVSVENDSGVASLPIAVTAQEFSANPGYVRSFFTGGAIFSKEREDFSKQDVFLGVNVEKNFAFGKKFGVNTYVDVRLTSIPVNVKDTSMQPTGGEEPTENVEDPATPDTLDTFLASKKTALMQFGIYAPVFIKGDDNSKYIAPIIKAGIQTITSGFNSAEAENFGRDDVFNFGAAGLRIGYQKYSKPDDVAPEMAYLDITRGKWENFEVLVPVKDNEGKSVTVRERRWRWGFEGRMMIPRVGFLIGFDANVGDGADDVRFIFGTRFDVGKLFKKLSAP